MRAFEAGWDYDVMEESLTVRRFHGGNASYDSAGARRANFDILRRRATRHRARSS